MARREERVIRLNKPSVAAFQVILAALKNEGFSVTHADAALGVVRATKGASLTSWGETIEIHIHPVGPATSDVVLSSESTVKMTMVDWGKNAKNLDQLARYLSSVP